MLTDIWTTGKATRGYDPSVDIEWLRSEIVRWILGNLMQKWYLGFPVRPTCNVLTNAGDRSRGDTLRSVSLHIFYLEEVCHRFTHTNLVVIESTAVETLQGQFSGYGSTSQTVARCLDRIGIKEPLEDWSDETVQRVVEAFIDEKFPTVFALNKIDHPDADKVCSHLVSVESQRAD